MLLKNIISGNTNQVRHQSKWLRIAFLIILVLFVFVPYAASNWDPYEVLGVRREATLDQIKRAYRDLARKFHPDKSHSNEDESESRFIELNKAFTILKDPARRSRYDQHGDIEENRHSRGYHQNNGDGGGYYRAARENWSAHDGFRTFTFFTSSGDSYYRKKSITTKQYYNEYLKESKRRPFLVFFYADFCPSCSMIESTWIKLTEELAKYNVGLFTINVHRESHLAHELGVSSIPYIACLLDTKLNPYYQTEISLPSLVRFIKNSLPTNLVPLLRTEHEQDRHIAMGPQQNRLSAIIINNEKATVKLRYTLLAYALRHYYRFGSVSTKLSDHRTLFKQYNLTASSRSHILVFNEQVDKPQLHLEYSSDNFNTSQYIRQLLSRPFLRLPKLSSQQSFDDLCFSTKPNGDARVKQVLCVVLFASPTPSSLPSRQKMLEFIERNSLEDDDKVAFAYLDPDKQSEFVQSLLAETESTKPTFIEDSIHSSLILIERHPTHNRKAHYQWIDARWDPKLPNELDQAKVELYQYIAAYRQGSFAPTDKVVLATLVDEEGPGLMGRIYARLVDSLSRIVYYMTSRESFSAIMILIACALITSLFLYKSPVPNAFSGQEATDFNYYRPGAEPRVSSRMKSPVYSSQNSSSMNNPPSPDSKLGIIELKAETYNGMVRLLKPGHRSIVLLADQESKDKLIAAFRKSVWPYRKNKTLLFGYLCLDRNLVWYKSLLEQILGCENLKVNKKNCIGTVLSLNGFKKYLRVYHAKHHEIDYYDDQTDNDGSFLGFDDDDERQDDLEHGAAGPVNGTNIDRSRDVIYTTGNLLDKLPIWLDKMFDGLTKRYLLDEWPEEIN